MWFKKEKRRLVVERFKYASNMRGNFMRPVDGVAQNGEILCASDVLGSHISEQGLTGLNTKRYGWQLFKGEMLLNR